MSEAWWVRIQVRSSNSLNFFQVETQCRIFVVIYNRYNRASNHAIWHLEVKAVKPPGARFSPNCPLKRLNYFGVWFNHINTFIWFKPYSWNRIRSTWTRTYGIEKSIWYYGTWRVHTVPVLYCIVACISLFFILY